MMSRPYEDPAKSDITGKLRVALDAAGYEVVDPVPLELPPDSEIGGHILGDLQSIDSDGRRNVYYVRTDGRRAVPQWIARLAKAARRRGDVQIHVVVEETTTVLEQSCRACGAGLLRLHVEAEYDLELAVSPDEFDPTAEETQRLARITTLRRRLVTKLDLNMEAAKRDYINVRSGTYGMPEIKREEYLDSAEAVTERWREWGERCSQRLDELAVAGTEAELDAIEREVEAGIQPPDEN
jgi:hypothetical protein